MKSRIYLRILSLVGFGILWIVEAHYSLINPLFLPSPYDIVATAFSSIKSGELTIHIAVSLGRMIRGFTIGSFAAILIGILMGQLRLVQAAVGPMIEIIRPIPGLAWIPLALIWFGIGDTSKIFIISLGVFFPVVTNTFMGVRLVDPVLVRAARCLGAKRRDIFFRISLPAALPFIFTGLRLGLQVSFAILVAAELVGATTGLGWMIQDARNYFRSDLVVLGMVIIGLLGFGLTRVIDFAHNRLLRWHTEAR